MKTKKDGTPTEDLVLDALETVDLADQAISQSGAKRVFVAQAGEVIGFVTIADVLGAQEAFISGGGEESTKTSRLIAIAHLFGDDETLPAALAMSDEALGSISANIMDPVVSTVACAA